MIENLADEAIAAMPMQTYGTVTRTDALGATREIASLVVGVIEPTLPQPYRMTMPESRVQRKGFCGSARTLDFS